MKKIRILAFVQARLTSKRLPNKVLLKIDDKTVIENIFLRLKNSKFLNKIVFLIPDNKKNHRLRIFLKKKRYAFLVQKIMFLIDITKLLKNTRLILLYVLQQIVH